MVERRKGGETGVKSVQCLEHEAVWNFLDQTPWAKHLFDRAVPTPLKPMTANGLGAW